MPSRTPQQRGRDFEVELRKEFGLKPVPGSGSVWWSKLDLKGRLARWSLKFTTKKSFDITQDMVDEAISACYGPGGDGSMPLWGVRIGDERYDLVVMLKQDFAALQRGEIQPLISEGREKTRQRKALASVPALLREED